MKIGIIVLLVAAVLGALIGTLMFRDPGYVLVSYGGYAAETSLWFGLVVLLLIYFVLRLVIFLFVRAAQGRGSLSAWNRRRRVRAARNSTLRGLLLIGEGRWAEAHKALLTGVGRVETPLINYLQAARSAHELGNQEERDRLLRLAHETTAGSRFAVGIAQARLQMEGAELEQCLATLLTLNEESPRHPLVLKMLLDCYRQLGDWRSLTELAPALKKAKVLDGEALSEVQREAWAGVLDGDTEGQAESLWKACPKELRRDAVVAAAGAGALVRDGSAAEAELVLRNALREQWQDNLVRAYGQLQGADAARQITTAESWLKERPNDAELLLALGRLSLQDGQWPKARGYFEASLKLRRSSETYGELGRLLNALGEHSRGSEYLILSLDDLPELPLPDATVGPDVVAAERS